MRLFLGLALCFLLRAARIEVITDPTKISILKDLRLSPSQVLDHSQEVKRYIEEQEALNNQLIGDRISLGILVFDSKYLELVDGKNFIDNFTALINKQWDTLKTCPMASNFHKVQMKALKQGKYEVVRFLRKQIDIWEPKLLQHFGLKSFTQKCSDWVSQTISDANQQLAARFMEDVVKRPVLHESIIGELFIVSSTVDEAIVFAAQQIVSHIRNAQRLLGLVQSEKSDDDIYKRMRIAIALQARLGNPNSALRDLLLIRNCGDTGEKRQRITNFLITLVDELGPIRAPLPDCLKHYLKDLEPFSLKWAYVKYRLLIISHAEFKTDLACLHDQRIDKMQRTQISLFFLLYMRVFFALRPFCSLTKKQQSFLPDLIFDYNADPMTMKQGPFENRLTVSLKQFLDAKHTSHYLETQFFSKKLPEAFKKCCEHPDYRNIMKPLSDSDLNSLLTIPRKVRSMRRKAKDEECIVNLVEDVKVLAVSSPDLVQERNEIVIVQEQSGNITTQEPGDVVEPSIPILASVSAEEKHFPQENSSKETVDQQIPLSKLVLETKVDASQWYNEEKAEKWMAKYKEELSRYEEMKELDIADGEFIKSTQKKAKVVATPKSINVCTNTMVASFSTNDFFELFPDCADLYNKNVVMGLAFLANSNKTMRFRWIFDPNIVIKHKTFLFLCQVFGELEGRKKLTFVNFQKAYFELNGQDLPIGKHGDANRTVFRSNHSFLVDGVTCIPPVGGVHPEHLSSRFNHVQVRSFLTKCGFHPFFFEIVE